MGLDYGWTCGDIDKNIDDAKQNIEDVLSDFMYDLNPLFMDTQEGIDLLKSYQERLYGEIEPCFEGVRETNQDMRKEADAQIEKLQDEIDQKDLEIEDLEEKVDLKEEDIIFLNDRIEYLEQLQQ